MKTTYKNVQKCVCTAGKEPFEYTIVRKSVKNVNLTCRPEKSANGKLVPVCTVIVSAGYSVSENFIRAFVDKNADRVLKIISGQIKRISEGGWQAQPDGSLSLFGIPVAVRTERIRSGKSRCAFDESKKELTVFVRNIGNTALKDRIVKEWQKEYFLSRAIEVCRKIEPLFPTQIVGVPSVITIETCRGTSRWGYCVPSKRLVRFNIRLLAFPPQCLEFVAVHEYCHFLHADHTAAFYAELGKRLPEWKSAREILRSAL